MTASKSSSDSPPSKLEWFAVAAAIVVLISVSDWWFYRNGYILNYGDAQAHLNISRSVVDSRTPGYEQIGTVWLPVLHVICLPFVSNAYLWMTGLAGTIPVSLCMLVAGLFFYVTARNVYGTSAAASAALACLLLNPNLLFLASAPMTECVFLAGLAALVFAADKNMPALGIAACWWMCLTRYDGWFLLPFAAAWFGLNNKSLVKAAAFAAAASLAPLYWIAHNWFETSNPLDFFNGPYSAKAIQGDHWYPGLHNWPEAIHYYSKAGQLCSGWTLLLLGVIGFFCLSNGRMLRVSSFLLLTPAFYVWSMHSSGNPVRIPQLWPHDYYNSRYGIAVAVWAAFTVGAAVTYLSRFARRWSPVLVVLAASVPWLFTSRTDWIVWKESDVNSRSRLAWTRQAADFLRSNYVAGQGVLAGFGDLTGIFCQAQIPIAENLHEGNGPLWLAAKTRPDLIHTEIWAIGQSKNFGPRYSLVKTISVPGAPPLLIYRRHYAAPKND